MSRFPGAVIAARSTFRALSSLGAREPRQKVFVHCRVGGRPHRHGHSRVSHAEQGWTAEEARKEMTVFGVNWFHNTICPRLGSYEKHFPEDGKTSPAFRELRSGKHPVQPRP